MSKALAIFDFDGTITTKDTLKAFILFTSGRKKYYLGLAMLSPILVCYSLGLVSRHRAKESILTHFFQSTSIEHFDQMAREFVEQKLPGLMRKKALQKIAQHRANGDRIVIVSASPENWVAKWAVIHGCETIGTRLQILNGRISGRISGENCQGYEKVNRIKSFLSLEQYSPIYTYGDTPGDRHFMQLGTEIRYRPF